MHKSNRIHVSLSAFVVYGLGVLVVTLLLALSAVYKAGSVATLSWHMMVPFLMQALLISFLFTTAYFSQRSLFFKDMATVCLVSMACAMCWVALDNLPSQKSDIPNLAEVQLNPAGAMTARE